MADRYDEELFLGYIEGDLTPEQTREFEKQLVDDARLRNLVAQLVIDRHRLRNLPKEQAPPNLMEAVNQTLERSMLLGAGAAEANNAATPERNFRMKRWMTYASVAALFVIGASLVINVLNNQAVHDLAQRPTVAAKPSASSTGKSEVASRTVRADEAPALAMGGEKRIVGLDAKPAGLESLAKKEMRAASDNAGSADTDAASPPLAAIAAADKKADALQDEALRERNSPAAPAVTVPSDGFESAKSKVNTTPAPSETAAAAAPAPVSAAPAAAAAHEPGFKSGDVPIPHTANRGPVFEPRSMRVDIAASAPAISERELLAWAEKNHAHIIQSSNSNLESERAEIAGAAKAAPTPAASAAPRRVVLVLEGRQVQDLLAHLNQQRGQTAALTDALSRPGFSAAVVHQASEEIHTNAGAVANTKLNAAETKDAATQPASQPAPEEKTAVRDTAPAAEPEQRVKIPPEAAVPPGSADARIRLPIVIEQAKPDR